MRIQTAVIDAADIPKHIIYQYEYKDCAIFNKAVKRFKVKFLCIGLNTQNGLYVTYFKRCLKPHLRHYWFPNLNI